MIPVAKWFIRQVARYHGSLWLMEVAHGTGALRELTAEEHSAIEKLAHARTAPARVVERASIIWFARR
jgi:hypothetical protein